MIEPDYLSIAVLILFFKGVLKIFKYALKTEKKRLGEHGK